MGAVPPTLRLADTGPNESKLPLELQSAVWGESDGSGSLRHDDLKSGGRWESGPFLTRRVGRPTRATARHSPPHSPSRRAPPLSTHLCMCGEGCPPLSKRSLVAARGCPDEIVALARPRGGTCKERRQVRSEKGGVSRVAGWARGKSLLQQVTLHDSVPFAGSKGGRWSGPVCVRPLAPLAFASVHVEAAEE
jgi:hypothetical protein